MLNIFYFILAAFFEISGCYLFWLYFKEGKSYLLLIPAVILLMLFAFILTRINVETVSRAYAIYGGIYIVCSLAWMYCVEKFSPDRWDYIGATTCVIGALIILFAPR